MTAGKRISELYHGARTISVQFRRLVARGLRRRNDGQDLFIDGGRYHTGLQTANGLGKDARLSALEHRKRRRR
jgi:hypothetical protein